MKDVSELYSLLTSEKVYNGLEFAAGAFLIGMGSAADTGSLILLSDSLGFTFAHYGMSNLIG